MWLRLPIVGCYKGENVKIRRVTRQPTGNKGLIILWREVNLHFFPFTYTKSVCALYIKYLKKFFLLYRREDIIYTSLCFSARLFIFSQINVGYHLSVCAAFEVIMTLVVTLITLLIARCQCNNRNLLICEQIAILVYVLYIFVSLLTFRIFEHNDVSN